MIDLYRYKIANEKLEVVYDIITKLDELIDAASGLDDQALQQAVEAYIKNMQSLIVDATQIDGTMEAQVNFDATLNKLSFQIPEGRAGEKGSKPEIEFALDNEGNLSYQITYVDDYADGIGEY